MRKSIQCLGCGLEYKNVLHIIFFRQGFDIILRFISIFCLYR